MEKERERECVCRIDSSWMEEEYITIGKVPYTYNTYMYIAQEKSFSFREES